MLDKKKLDIESRKILDGDLFVNGVNISVVKVLSDTQIEILTYERGVGITNACGSGAGAAAYASHKVQNSSKNIDVVMTGGNLKVEITKDDHILTIGDAKIVFKGSIKL